MMPFAASMIEQQAVFPTHLLGEALLSIEPCHWGFTNQTSLVTLASGRRVILQQISDATQAQRLVRLTHELPALFATAAINAPQLLESDLSAQPPCLVRSYIPGTSANLMLDTPQTAHTLAQQMGSLLAKLHSLPTPNWLDAIWAQPDTLAIAATEWLRVAIPQLASIHIQQIEEQIATLAQGWPEAAPTLAHGDFCPVNAIAEHGQIVGLVDLEWARVASPAFDAAWWGWVVRYHHPERWQETWRLFLEASNLPDTTVMQQHIFVIQQLRCLELLADAIQTQHSQRAAMWAERLQAPMPYI